MAIATTRDGTTLKIEISGRFDFLCRADFREAYIAAPTDTHFVIDLHKADYVDSAALGMLLMLRDQVQDATRITITGTQGQPEQVLKVANFHKLFRFE